MTPVRASLRLLRGLFRIIFISHLSKECKLAQDVKFARIAHDQQLSIKVPADDKSSMEKCSGCWKNNLGDLFRVLLNGFLQILKRKLKKKQEHILLPSHRS